MNEINTNVATLFLKNSTPNPLSKRKDINSTLGIMIINNNPNEFSLLDILISSLLSSKSN